MKHLPILLTIVCGLSFLVGCEQPINEQEQNQPVNPATFSLVGKKYVCEGSHPSIGLDYVADVLYFFSADSMVYYSTEYKDFELNKALHSDYGIYKMNYPNIVVTFGADERPFVLQDTATIYSPWWEQTFLLNF